jgi:FolB domain-containing protein
MKNNTFISPFSDSIFIEGIQLKTHIGVTAKERRIPQKLSISLYLFLSLKKAGQSDELTHTIDYAQVVKQTQLIAQKGSFHLLESLADNIAKLILTKFRVKRIGVKVSKFILPHVAETGVFIWLHK